jgi:hypothetical protein
MTDETTPAPFNVEAHAAPVAMSEASRAMILGGCALAVDHFMHSETAIIAVLAGAGFLLTAGYSLVHRLTIWGRLRRLAGIVDDSVATVGKPK